MNIVLHDAKADEFYLASLKKSGDNFWAFGKKVSRSGILKSTGQIFKFEDRKDAEQKVRDLVKIKIKCRSWKPIMLDELPKKVIEFLEVPPEMQVSAEEMVMILRYSKWERYIIFEDVSGLDEYFDAGVEYVGYKTEDQDTVKVFDRYGTLRECFVTRVRSMEMTERAIEACALKITVMKNREVNGAKPIFINHNDFYASQKKKFEKAVS